MSYKRLAAAAHALAMPYRRAHNPAACLFQANGRQ